MSKEEDARVRDELLQRLYAGVLEAKLARVRAGRTTAGYDGSALAAGVAANLRRGDLLLLPAGRGDSLRALCGRPIDAERRSSGSDQTGVLELPREEAQAVAMAVGVAAALAHAGQGAVACVRTTAGGTAKPGSGPPLAGSGSRSFPADWAGAGAWAARRALPLLLLAEHAPRRTPAAGPEASAKPAHLLPAPLFPSIPVDRDDALAVYRVAFECAARARAGGGPSELRHMPFRISGRRADIQVAVSPDEEPLSRLEAALRARGAFPAGWKRRLERDLVRKLST